MIPSYIKSVIAKTIDVLYEEDVNVTHERWQSVILPLIKELEGLEAVEHRVQRIGLDDRPHKEPCICVACEAYDNGEFANR